MLMSRRLRESRGVRARRLWFDGVVSWDALFGVKESFEDISKGYEKEGIRTMAHTSGLIVTG
jgi:hypothetical protein